MLSFLLIDVVFCFVSPFVRCRLLKCWCSEVVMTNEVVTRSSAREKECQEKSFVLRSALQLGLKKMGVDYDAICTCQVNLSVVSSCCLFSLSVSLLLSFVSIVILYIISFVVSTHLSFCLSFSLFYFYLPFIFLYCVYFLSSRLFLFYYLSVYLVSIMVISLSLPAFGVVQNSNGSQG